MFDFTLFTAFVRAWDWTPFEVFFQYINYKISHTIIAQFTSISWLTGTRPRDVMTGGVVVALTATPTLVTMETR